MEVLTLINDPAKFKRVARLMKTVGHPSRLMIIDLLLEHGKLSVGEIQEAVNISQSNASQHLRALEDIGVLFSERDGKSVLYGIENKQIFNLLQCVNDCTTC